MRSLGVSNEATALAAWLGSARGSALGATDLELGATALSGTRGSAQSAFADTAAAERFAREARRTGLSGLVLEQADLNGWVMPETIAGRLRDSARGVAAANLKARQELEHVVAALDAAGVPVMLLKGAALQLTIYDRPELRPISDVDLMIRPDSVSAAFEALETCGCRRGQDLIRGDFFPRYYYEVEWLTDAGRPVRIDLHVRPLRPMRLARTMPDDALWRGARVLPIGCTRAYLPRCEFMLIHLAAHAAFHGCSRLIWLYDIARWVQRYGHAIDWSLVLRKAGEWRLNHAVSFALDRVEEELGLQCPVGFRDEMRQLPVDWRDRLVLRHTPRDAAAPLTHVLVNLLSTPGWAFRWQYVAAMARPDAAHLAAVYPLRHPGWIVCAHLWRGLRTVWRMFAAARRGLVPSAA